MSQSGAMTSLGVELYDVMRALRMGVFLLDHKHGTRMYWTRLYVSFAVPGFAFAGGFGHLIQRGVHVSMVCAWTLLYG